MFADIPTSVMIWFSFNSIHKFSFNMMYSFRNIYFEIEIRTLNVYCTEKHQISKVGICSHWFVLAFALLKNFIQKGRRCQLLIIEKYQRRWKNSAESGLPVWLKGKPSTTCHHLKPLLLLFKTLNISWPFVLLFCDDFILQYDQI